MIVRNIKKYHFYIHLVYTKSLFYNNSTSFKIRFADIHCFSGKNPLLTDLEGVPCEGTNQLTFPCFLVGFMVSKKHVIVHTHFHSTWNFVEDSCSLGMQLAPQNSSPEQNMTFSVQSRSKGGTFSNSLKCMFLFNPLWCKNKYIYMRIYICIYI